MILHYLIEKEFKQIFRNILLPIIFVLLPVALMNMVPRIATQEIKGLKFTVVDNDHSTASQRLIHKIEASTYLNLTGVATTYEEAMTTINSGDADIILEIEPGFERNILREGNGHIMVSANSTNGTKGTMGQNYLMQIVQAFGQEMREENGQAATPLQAAAASGKSYSIAPRFLFNISLDYKRYMIPAILALVIMIIVGFLPALNIVGEKEKGTIEQINVTPVRKWEFILSKLIPYFIIGMFMLTLAVLAARGIYGFTPRGSILTLYLFAALFSLVSASFGLVVSNYATSMQQGALAVFFFMIIMMLMSGLLTPVASMPQWALNLTYINPMRYSIEAFRAIYVKGASFAQLQLHFWAMIGLTLVLGTWAIMSYRKNS